MGNPSSFDQNYGLNTAQEKAYLQTNTVENLKKEFGGDLKKLERSVIVNYHTENLNKLSDTQISKIKEVTGERYNQLLNIKAGGSEGIAALQILAIVCVEKMNDKDVAKILSDEYIKSDSVDGILGPNTLFLLKEISKTTLGGAAISDWNGVIDYNNYALFDKMLNICGNKQSVTTPVLSPEKQIEENMNNLTNPQAFGPLPTDTEGNIRDIEDPNKNNSSSVTDEAKIQAKVENVEVSTALASVQLSDGKEKGNGNINSFNEIYSFLENSLNDYLPKKSPNIKTWERKFTSAVNKNKSDGSENPYLAGYKQLLRETDTQLSFDAKVCYTSLLLSAFREEDKEITYDATYNILKEMSPEEWNIITKGVDLQPMIQIIKQDVKFQQVPNHEKIPLSSFQDILAVYNVALDNYRKNKGTKEQVNK